MSTKPEETESSDTEVSDQDLEIVVGGQGYEPPVGSRPFDPTEDLEPQPPVTGPYNPPQPKY